MFYHIPFDPGTAKKGSGPSGMDNSTGLIPGVQISNGVDPRDGQQHGVQTSNGMCKNTGFIAFDLISYVFHTNHCMS